jgi:hypothetical protein
MKFLNNVQIVALALTISTSAIAESLADKIKKRAAETSEVKALLNDPDQNTRIAALDVMLKSQDTAMREIGYTTGFNSADDTLRAIALRNKFNELNSITVYFELPENPTENKKEIYDGWSGSLVMGLTAYNEANGNFRARDQFSSSKNDSNVSGLSVNFKTNYCGGTLVLNEESVLEGEITCEKQSFSATANII